VREKQATAIHTDGNPLLFKLFEETQEAHHHHHPVSQQVSPSLSFFQRSFWIERKWPSRNTAFSKVIQRELRHQIGLDWVGLWDVVL
jgi:hypothetical protein